MRYCVIEFKELPYADIDKYICVPGSWIKWRNKSKSKLIVAYPVEKPSYTQRRVQKGAIYSRNWKCFLAKAEYNTNGYNEAVNFIEYLNYKRNRNTEDSNKKQQNKEKSSSSDTNVPGHSKTHDNETLDGDTNVPGHSKTHDNETSDGNTNVPGPSKTHDIETSDDDTYVLSDLEVDTSEISDDATSSDDSDIEEPPSNHKRHKPSERSHGKSKIILPPEYDPDFPRWSLKYPGTNYRGRMDLVELRPKGEKTGIYVNTREYDKCFEISDTDNTLARNLMRVIFTRGALGVCTLTGKVPVKLEGRESKIRLGLHVHGVKALVETVLEHGRGESDESTIRSCISAKLGHLRFKH